MANCNRFGYQQAIPHSSFIASTSKVLVFVGQKEKKKDFPVAWLNHPKPVQVCQDRYINGLDQEKPVIPTQKAYWTRTVSCGQPFRDYSNMKVLDFNRSRVTCLYGLSFHVVGKRVCLVMLWPNPARRDKPWNYIPLEFQRYTKLIRSTGYLYGHVGNGWGIQFPKRMK